eukprot:TRINITY_DN7746_c0_g3_i2.p1 TRINITY_DN7746_c0_g3~~TRINITY_DN7746_c0_g3_i2.p1  ORF type:complete len:231 (-),score=30.80 TRINITY_DN7746_c0_g3_i2:248-940(-)
MPPFFTMAGAMLDLDAMIANATGPPVLFGIRFAAIAVGSFSASRVTGQETTVRDYLWMTLQSQSGVTLGLVAQMQIGMLGRQPWAKDTAAVITGCVVLNQLVGPTLCRYGIRQAGEANDDEDDEVTLVDMEPRLALRSERSTRRHSTAKQTIMSEAMVIASKRPSTVSILSLSSTLGIGKTKSSVSFALEDVEAVLTSDTKGNYEPINQNHGGSSRELVPTDGSLKTRVF